MDEDQGEVSGMFGEDGMVGTMDPVCHKRSLVAIVMLSEIPLHIVPQSKVPLR